MPIKNCLTNQSSGWLRAAADFHRHKVEKITIPAAVNSLILTCDLTILKNTRDEETRKKIDELENIRIYEIEVDDEPE